MAEVYEEEDNFIPMDPSMRPFAMTSWLDTYKNITLPTEIILVPPVVQRLFINEYPEDLLNEDLAPEYKKFVQEITNAIERFGGIAYIRNNFHSLKVYRVSSKTCPGGYVAYYAKYRDSTETIRKNIYLKFSTWKQVISAMAGSDTILSAMMEVGEVPNVVAIRPWVFLHPATCFRALVINKKLRGITPRSLPNNYKILYKNEPTIIEMLKTFFSIHIRDFPANNFVFDVMLSITYRNIVLLDIGPLNYNTTLHAFEREQIEALMERADESDDVEPIFNIGEITSDSSYIGPKHDSRLD